MVGQVSLTKFRKGFPRKVSGEIGGREGLHMRIAYIMERQPQYPHKRNLRFPYVALPLKNSAGHQI